MLERRQSGSDGERKDAAILRALNSLCAQSAPVMSVPSESPFHQIQLSELVAAHNK